MAKRQVGETPLAGRLLARRNLREADDSIAHLMAWAAQIAMGESHGSEVCGQIDDISGFAVFLKKAVEYLWGFRVHSLFGSWWWRWAITPSPFIDAFWGGWIRAYANMLGWPMPICLVQLPSKIFHCLIWFSTNSLLSRRRQGQRNQG